MFNFSDYVTPPSIPSAYAPLVQAAAQKYGVPLPVLSWVGWRENGWNPTTEGPKTSTGTAKGLYQFMDGTARELGIDPMDPAQAIDGAARYLRQLYGKTGNWTDAVGRYGTFSTGQGPARDTALRLGLRTHLANVGLDPTSAPPADPNIPLPTLTGPPQSAPVPADAQMPNVQGQPGVSLADIIKDWSQNSLQNTRKDPMAYDPTSAEALAQQVQGNTGVFSPINLLRMAAGFAGKMNFGQGISEAAGNLASGAQVDQNQALAIQKLLLDAHRANTDDYNADTQRLSTMMTGQAGLQNAQTNAAGLPIRAYEAQTGRIGANTNAALLPIHQQQANAATSTALGGIYERAAQVSNMTGVPISAILPSMLAGMTVPGGEPATAPDLSSVRTDGPGLGQVHLGNIYENPNDLTAPAYREVVGAHNGKTRYQNTATGAYEDHVPSGYLPATPGMAKPAMMESLNAYNQAAQQQQSDAQVLPYLMSAKEMLLKNDVPTGGDVISTLKRNLQNLYGNSANSVMDLILTRLGNQQAAAMRNQGLTVRNQAEYKNVMKGAANWQTQPEAMLMMLNKTIADIEHNNQFMNAGTEQAAQNGGWLRYRSQWLKDNPYPTMSLDDATTEYNAARAKTRGGQTGTAGGLDFTFRPSVPTN